MTQEIIDRYFNTSLGEQCDVLYSTSDDRVFIRHEEAIKYTNGKLEEPFVLLEDKNIISWYKEPELYKDEREYDELNDVYDEPDPIDRYNPEC